MMSKEIIPAILSYDFDDLEEKFSRIEGVSAWAQIDVMDGVFVDTVSFDLKQLCDFKTDLKLEAHLMVEKPTEYLELCKEIGFSRVVFHVESADDPSDVISGARNLGMQVGIACNPETDVSEIEPYIMWVDLVLFLGVHPGRGGQEFIPSVLDKITALRDQNSNAVIQVDGGVNETTIKSILEAGADIFVVGSGLFGAEDVEKHYAFLVNNVSE